MKTTNELARLRAAENACRAAARLITALTEVEISVVEDADAQRLGELASKLTKTLDTWHLLKVKT